MPYITMEALTITIYSMLFMYYWKRTYQTCLLIYFEPTCLLIDVERKRKRKKKKNKCCAGG